MIDIDVNQPDVSANRLGWFDYPKDAKSRTSGGWPESSQVSEKKDGRRTERGSRQCPADEDSLGGL